MRFGSALHPQSQISRVLNKNPGQYKFTFSYLNFALYVGKNPYLVSRSNAGDVTARGDLEDVKDFNTWLGTLPHPHKIMIAGNHDFCFERDPSTAQAMITNATYLQDSGVTIEGIRIWGTPWQPEFHNWAFNLPRGEALRAKWGLIPSDTDVLITHGPPMGYGDRTFLLENVGCQDLTDAVERLTPRLHVFGHIHEGYGVTQNEQTTFVNASMVDSWNRPTNKPIVIEW